MKMLDIIFLFIWILFFNIAYAVKGFFSMDNVDKLMPTFVGCIFTFLAVWWKTIIVFLIL